MDGRAVLYQIPIELLSFCSTKWFPGRIKQIILAKQICLFVKLLEAKRTEGPSKLSWMDGCVN